MRLSNPRAGIALRRRQVGLVSRLGNRQERERHQRENHDLFHFFINPFSLNFCLLSTVNVLVLSYVRSDPYKVFCLKYSDTGTNDWDERTRAGVDSARKPLKQGANRVPQIRLVKSEVRWVYGWELPEDQAPRRDRSAGGNLL